MPIYKKGDSFSNKFKQTAMILALVTHTGLDFKFSEWLGGKKNSFIYRFGGVVSFC